MSRIGKKIITIPKGVEVKVTPEVLQVKGPKGTLQEKIPPAVSVAVQDGVMSFAKVRDEKGDDAAHGLVRALAANMVIGVTEGFQRALEIGPAPALARRPDGGPGAAPAAGRADAA